VSGVDYEAEEAWEPTPLKEPALVPLWQVNVLRGIIYAALLALAAWWAFSAITMTVKEPERERRIESCVAAMFNNDGSGPVKACEALDADERREASYEYLQRLGWL
jgi:hypothetical protein